MTREEAEKLVIRFSRLFRKDKNYYAFNYNLPHTIDDKVKSNMKRSPGLKKNQSQNKLTYNI